MIDNSRRYRIHLEVCHLICTDHHCTFLLIKGINYLLKSIRSAVYIIAIQLYGKLTTLIMMDCKVPATSDAKVILSRDYMNQIFMFCRKVFKQFCCTICRMVVNYYYIVLERALLAQGTLNGILYSLDSIENRDNH